MAISRKPKPAAIDVDALIQKGGGAAGEGASAGGAATGAGAAGAAPGGGGVQGVTPGTRGAPTASTSTGTQGQP